MVQTEPRDANGINIPDFYRRSLALPKRSPPNPGGAPRTTQASGGEREPPQPPEPPEPPPSSSPTALIGRKVIADFLGIRETQLAWLLKEDKRRAPKRTGIPVYRQPGLGLVADRTRLSAWWADYLAGKGPKS